MYLSPALRGHPKNKYTLSSTVWSPFFFARALSTGRSFNHTIFFQALAISIGAGWIDEIIQGLLPHRYYDIHDVMLNAVSALLGLMIYALFTFHPSTIKKRPEK
jgi:glycopeptide antibiotics resistance protein